MKHLSFADVFILFTSILAWVVSAPHPNRPSGCSLDGTRIDPLYEVIIVPIDKSFMSFSCVLSAGIWFRANDGQTCSILVTDEATGRKVKAEKAFYVLSEVVTTPYTGNRIHVFAERANAGAHARRFNGKLVMNPFEMEGEIPVLSARNGFDSPSVPDLLFPSSQDPLSLQARTDPMNLQDCFHLPHEYSNRFSDLSADLPDKPPRTLV